MRYKLVEKFFIKLKGSSVPGGGRGGGAGRQSAPPQKKETSDREIPIDLSGKDKEKKGKLGKKVKKKENWKDEGEIFKMEGGKLQNEERFLFLFLFFFFSLFTFQNEWNLFLVYQNGNFLPGKSISRREKNQEKWLCPLRKIFLLRPCWRD